jgi:aspartate kinase
VVTAALSTGGIPSVHLDARQMILTDDQHTHAAPLYWETYAKLRRVVPGLAKDGVVVMGGFIGSSENGATTTLGRGGSDLTASIVGAGISAEEIQIWTDVDGMLTCDPRVLAGGLRLRSISYEEATAMASAGAKVLHADSVSPAVRQLIPIVIRNSRQPEVEGTRIGPAAPSAKLVKSISCRQNQNVLEIGQQDAAGALMQLCARHGLPAELIGQQGSIAFLAIGNDYRYEQLRTELNGCVQVHLRANRAILTLIGDGIATTTDFSKRALAALKNIPASVVPQTQAERTIRLIVPQSALERCTRLLHREFFKQVDPAVFAEVHEPVCDAPRRRTDKAENRPNSRTEHARRLVLVRQN